MCLQALSGSEASHPLGVRQQPHAPQPQVPVEAQAQEPRETAEYQAALELEMWKEQQEAMFQAKVG